MTEMIVLSCSRGVRDLLKSSSCCAMGRSIALLPATMVTSPHRPPHSISNVKRRMPTRLGNGEGRVSGEAIDTGTRLDPPGYGARHGGRGERDIGGGPSRLGAGSPTVAQAAGRTGVGEGHTTGEAGSCWRRKGPLLLVRCGGSRGSVIGDEPGTPLRIRTLLKKLYPAAKTDADRCCWARLPSPTASAARTALGAVCRAVKPVGKPDAGNPHVRFDERGRETERCRMAQATAPVLDSTMVESGADYRRMGATLINARPLLSRACLRTILWDLVPRWLSLDGGVHRFRSALAPRRAERIDRD